MAFPDLPLAAKSFSAMPNMRWRHRYWHLVKNPDFVNNPINAPLVEALKNIGWTAALTGEPGAGLDFLSMHRMMIENIDVKLAAANDPNWPEVVGWPNIPAAPDDQDWPEPHIDDLDNPAAWPEQHRNALTAIREARSDAVVTRNLRFADTFRNSEFIQREDITLDRYGHLIEVTVHNWMHMRYAASPPDDPEDVSVANDYLGAPFSSHVNPYFWKLHGWIDDCISIWEETRGEEADFSTAWRAPMEAPPFDDLEMPADILGAPESVALIPSFTTFSAPAHIEAEAFKALE